MADLNVWRQADFKNALGLVRTVRQIPRATPSGFDFLFRTRPRALWQQTPPEPVCQSFKQIQRYPHLRAIIEVDRDQMAVTASSKPWQHLSGSQKIVNIFMNTLHIKLAVYLHLITYKDWYVTAKLTGDRSSAGSLAFRWGDTRVNNEPWDLV